VRTRTVRIGAIVMLAVAMSCGVCRESAAQTVDRSSTQPRQAATRGQGTSAAPADSSGPHSGLGAMHYYGGPKSPMWRGPAAE